MTAVDKFQQNASGALGMDEDVAMATSSDLDFFRDQAHTFSFQFGDGRGQIGNTHANVVQTLATLSDKLRDRGIVGGSLEQLESAFAYGDHDEADFFLWHGFLRGNGEAEFFVDGFRFGERLDRDSEMIDLETWLLALGFRLTVVEFHL